MCAYLRNYAGQCHVSRVGTGRRSRHMSRCRGSRGWLSCVTRHGATTRLLGGRAHTAAELGRCRRHARARLCRAPTAHSAQHNTGHWDCRCLTAQLVMNVPLMTCTTSEAPNISKQALLNVPQWTKQTQQSKHLYSYPSRSWHLSSLFLTNTNN